MIIEFGKTYQMRNGAITPPLQCCTTNSMASFEGDVTQGWHTGGTLWDSTGRCVGGSTTFSYDIGQFDIVKESSK